MNEYAIAIIGMAGRFPGANSVDELWTMVCEGRSGLTNYSRAQLEASGIPGQLLDRPDYIRVSGSINDVDLFDADYFGIPPAEAEVMDPQLRVLLECAVDALESAGYSPPYIDSSVGVFCGASMSTYLLYNLMPFRGFAAGQNLPMALANDKDYAATSISYRLNLRGPSMSVQTACSTSLVAAHVACQSLLSGECDMALAGGVTIRVPQAQGYYYSEDGIAAMDGVTRTFDAAAQGTVFGNGCGVVVLKRYDDAIRDGDEVDAVVIGSAVNNDGSVKAGFAAPSVRGQASAIAEALDVAKVSAGTIGLVEAHGTATPIGDPIELEALSKAFSETTSAKQFCALGSVKTNVGHLEAAAGVTGLIKAVMAIKSKVLPPTLNYSRPNPAFNFDGSPFFVNTEKRSWVGDGTPRRAGVSSFGIGGTNAHLVLEEAPRAGGKEAEVEKSSTMMLPISAKDDQALKSLVSRFVNHLSDPTVSVADTVYSAVRRRGHHSHRVALVGRSREALIDLASAFCAGEARHGLANGFAKEGHCRRIAFVFPGQGSQWLGMGKELIEADEGFASTIEVCERAMQPWVDWSLVAELRATAERSMLERVDVIQPAIFAVQVALAELWRSKGIYADAVIGHSMGEVAAACVAGALSLEDAARIICIRSQMVRRASGDGAMVVVGVGVEALGWLIESYEGRVSVAAMNGPSSCVLAVDSQVVPSVLSRLSTAEIFCRQVNVDYASHSSHMDPLLGDLRGALRGLRPRKSELILLSTVTGGQIGGAELDADYWCSNLREPVRFGPGIESLLESGFDTFVEVSPHPIMTSVVRDCAEAKSVDALIVASQHRERPAMQTWLQGLGELYVRGVMPNWDSVDGLGGRFVRLPRYPWQRRMFWIGGQGVGYDANVHPQRQNSEGGSGASAVDGDRTPSTNDVVRDSQYRTEWKERDIGVVVGEPPRGTWLVVDSEGRTGASLVQSLEASGHRTIRRTLMQLDGCKDLEGFVETLDETGDFRGFVYIAERVDAERDDMLTSFGNMLRPALHMIQAIGLRERPQSLRALLVTRSSQPLGDATLDQPCLAALWGLWANLGQEYSEFQATALDLDLRHEEDDVESIVAEMRAADPTIEVAVRSGQRYVASLSRRPTVSLSPDERCIAVPGRSYLVTGGLGWLGLETAKWLVDEGAGELVLVGRNPPSREALQVIESLRRRGASVHAMTCDVGRQADVARLFGELAKHHSPIGGVFHLASVMSDGVVRDMDWSQFGAAMHSKAASAWYLHQHTKNLQLDCFVLFSSIVSQVGSHGQSAYTSANRFLDALAHYRRERGLPGLAVSWGAWKQPRVEEDQWLDDLRLTGIDRFGPDIGFFALRQFMTDGAVHVGFLPGFRPNEWFRHRPQLLAQPAFEGLINDARTQVERSEVSGIAETLRSIADENERRTQLVDYVRSETALALRISKEDVGNDTPFRDLGLNSLLGLELRRKLAQALCVRVSAAAIFNFPTVELLAGRLLGQLIEDIHDSNTGGQTAEPNVGERGGEQRTGVSEEEMIAALSEEEAVEFLQEQITKLGIEQ